MSLSAISARASRTALSARSPSTRLLAGPAYYLASALYRSQPFSSLSRPRQAFTHRPRLQSSAFHTSTPRHQINKIVPSTDSALAGLESGHTVLFGGFGLSGVPFALIDAVERSGIDNITAVSNNAGVAGKGLGRLVESGQLKRLIASYVGENTVLERQFLSGQIEIELTPQGTLAERCRAGGAGIPAFYTPAGLNTVVQTGDLNVRYPSENGEGEYARPRDVRVFASPDRAVPNRPYVLEHAIRGDFALIKAHKADRLGNCVFRYAARNFNPTMAKAGQVTVVEAEEIVDVGEIGPDEVHLPGIYVDRVIKTPAGFDKMVERIITRQPDAATSSSASSSALSGSKPTSSAEMSKRERIARRAALEFKDGMYANLGIGMPMMAASFVDPAIEVILQSENGILGLGDYPTAAEVDPDLINAGKETVTLKPGAAVFSADESFGMIRSGRVDLTVLGGMQVSATGDLANWMLPGKVKGFGGAIDLASNPRSKTRVVVTMEHTDKAGRPKIVRQCDFPLTGKGCVSRIITDMGVFDADPVEGLTLVEIADGVTIEDITASTDAPFHVAQDLQQMRW